MSFYEDTLNTIRETVTELELDPAVWEILKKPQREAIASIPVRMHDGTLQVFEAFRVQHNNALGPCKGGIRFHPKVDLDTVRALATEMSLKTSLAGLPLGGGKGGVTCNPKELTPGELEQICRGYVRTFLPILGPDIDVPAPDVGTTPQHMAWMEDEFRKLTGKRGVVTGKPVPFGGSLGRDDATARGGMICLDRYLECTHFEYGFGNANRVTCSIHGFGNAGIHAARLSKERHLKVVSVSDSTGGLLGGSGIDIDGLITWKNANKTVKGYHNVCSDVASDTPLYHGMVLIPAALENVITEQNAHGIPAKVIIELANGAITPAASQILYEKGTKVIPDILANAGGVTVSYFEMIQNKTNQYWPLKKVHEELKTHIEKAYWAVSETSARDKINMKKASYRVAINRIAEAMKIREWI